MDEGPLGVHQVELMVKPGPGLHDGRGVGQAAHRSLDLIKVNISLTIFQRPEVRNPLELATIKEANESRLCYGECQNISHLGEIAARYNGGRLVVDPYLNTIVAQYIPILPL